MLDIDIEALGSSPRPYFGARIGDHGVVTERVSISKLGLKLAAKREGLEDGIFGEWHWNGTQLTVRNDRYGVYPLFYAFHDGEIRISPAIDYVVQGRIPRTLDHEALAVLFRLGHLVGEDTPFKHVRVLPPNSTLTWTARGLDIQRAPGGLGFRGRQSIAFDDAVDTYIQLFDRTIERRRPTGDRYTVPISGGRDSRHILLALDKMGAVPAFCPMLQYRPPAANDDVRIAGMITQRMGIEHVQIGRPVSWFEAVLKDISLTNYCGGAHSWSLPLAAYLTEHVDTMYDGLAGSVLAGGFMLDGTKLALCLDRKLEELAIVLLKEAKREGFNKTILTADFLAKSSCDAAIARLVEELGTHMDADNPKLSFIFWNRTRRSVGSIPFSIMSGVETVHCPYLDHEVFDFLTTLDPAMFLDNKLHDTAIARGYPQHANIPFEDKSIRAGMNADAQAYYRQSVRKFAGYLARRGLGSSEIVRTGYVYPRVLFDLAARKGDLPWYLISTLYALELDRVSGSA